MSSTTLASNIIECNITHKAVEKKLERRHDNQYIPIGVWLHKDLSIAEKALLVDINAYAIERGYCWAPNGLLGESLGLSISRTSELVASLQAKGLISIEYIKDGKQHLERQIKVNPEFDFRAPPEWYEEDESNPTAHKFTGVNIPLYIWENKALSIGQRMMLGQIALLEGKIKGCFAGNQHFSELFGLSIRQVSRIISSLSESGYIIIQQIRADKKCVERRIYTVRVPVDKSTSGHNPNTPPSPENDVNPFGKRPEPLRKVSRPSSENVQDKDAVKEKDKETDKDTGRAALAGLRNKSFLISSKNENQKPEQEVGQAKESVKQSKINNQPSLRDEGTISHEAKGQPAPSKAITPRQVKDLYDKVLGKTLSNSGALTTQKKQQLLSLINLPSLKNQHTGSAVAEAAFWAELFNAVKATPYLIGRNNDSGWAADFAWLTQERNIIKVLGGVYNKRDNAFYASEKAPKHVAPYSPDGVDHSRAGLKSAGKIAEGVFKRQLTDAEILEMAEAQASGY
jgi:DNA-binding MarR family transcriptional regulator